MPVNPVEDPFVAARRHGHAARSALSGPDRDVATAAAVAALCALPELAAPGAHGRVALSSPVRGELDVRGAASSLRARGWSTWLPVVLDHPDDSDGPDSSAMELRSIGAREMEFREWRPEDVMTTGRFGIAEPPDDGRPGVDARDMDVVVTPCVAVDETGTRVGFGAGYYDRALAEPDGRPVVVVAAFDVQVLRDGLLRRGWDVPADVIVTERRTIRLRPA